MCMAEYEGFRCTLYGTDHHFHEAWDSDGVLCARWPNGAARISGLEKQLLFSLRYGRSR